MRQGHAASIFRATKYIQIDTHKCQACWKCLAACPNDVFRKINLPFHKHIRLERPELCKGCRKCLAVCEQHAISPV